MGKVKILSDDVVNKIAAGEVVERPSSVVKELVENALDAGATEISVSILEGGRSLIEVVDNGSGMSEDDALTALERFGTSKVSSAEQLFSIETLGFRGEALPSIASVSKLHILTREADAAAGFEIMVEGGERVHSGQVSTGTGTRITVKDLFYNVPARKRFLRSPLTEEGMVRSLVTDFALACPAVDFRLFVDGRKTFDATANPDFFAKAERLEVAGASSFRLDERFERLFLQGLLCMPAYSVGSSSRLRLLVNGRVVRDRVLLRAVREGYGGTLKAGRHPAGVIKLAVSPEDVDVNVHPQKAEVRFRESERIFGAVQRAVSRALARQGVEDVLQSEPPVSFSRPASVLFSKSAPAPSGPASWTGTSRLQNVYEPEPGWGLAGHGTPGLMAARPSVFPFESRAAASCEDKQTRPFFALGEALPGILESAHFVGQAFQCFLIFETKDELLLLDMHAAHERVVYAKLLEQAERRAVETQLFLLPQQVKLPEDKWGLVERWQDEFERAGILVSESRGTLEVTGLPVLIMPDSFATFVDDLLALDEDQSPQTLSDRRLHALCAKMACHNSLRQGRRVDADEARALLEQSLALEAGGICPHGRPVVRHLPRRGLEELFDRS